MKRTIAAIVAGTTILTSAFAYSFRADDKGETINDHIAPGTHEVAITSHGCLDELAEEPLEGDTPLEGYSPLEHVFMRAIGTMEKQKEAAQSKAWSVAIACKNAAESLSERYSLFSDKGAQADHLYGLPNSKSWGLLLRLAEHYPEQNAMINYAKEFAFEKDDTIPRDYLWRIRPTKTRTSRLKGWYERAHERMKDLIGAKTSLSPTYRAKLEAAREKDQLFITGLYAIEKQLESCLDGCLAEKMQDLLFDYGLIASARQEYVRSVFDKGVENLSAHDLRIR